VSKILDKIAAKTKINTYSYRYGFDDPNLMLDRASSCSSKEETRHLQQSNRGPDFGVWQICCLWKVQTTGIQHCFKITFIENAGVYR